MLMTVDYLPTLNTHSIDRRVSHFESVIEVVMKLLVVVVVELKEVLVTLRRESSILFDYCVLI